MHFQFLIEDQSSEVLVYSVMNKLVTNTDDITFNCKSFRGLGGFTKKNTIKETKEGKLLNDLATYMRGFNKSLKGIAAAIIVVLDNDDRDTNQFESELINVAQSNMIDIDYVFCIAVEEVEAWLLGDQNAVAFAYPNARQQILHSYKQDSICGTWEVLADVVYSGGVRQLKKDSASYAEIGKLKSEWAYNIGKYMNIEFNFSPSFMSFIGELKKRINYISE